MATQAVEGRPVPATGAAGDVGAIGRHLTAMLLAKGHEVRALVRREDERAEGLRQLGAEVVQGDLTDPVSAHQAIEGCARLYFGMSVSEAHPEATVNVAVVARHHGVEAFVNMSQMTVTQMSITETTGSPPPGRPRQRSRPPPFACCRSWRSRRRAMRPPASPARGRPCSASPQRGTADRAFRKAAGASERRGNNASPRSRCGDQFNRCRSAATQPAEWSMRRVPRPESHLRFQQQ